MAFTSDVKRFSTDASLCRYELIRTFVPETFQAISKMKKLIIFDLDGTLLDTIADLAAATNHALQCCGWPVHPTEAYRYFVGNGIDKLFERALPEDERSTENIRKMRSLFLPYYTIHNADLSRPYPGIPELLSSLQQQGALLAVASNKYQEATQKLIGQFFPSICFTAVFGQREGVPTKPDPSVVFEIMNRAGATPEETTYIGDSSVDMQTGHNAGVTTVGVSWGFRPRTELEAYAPHFIADTTGELSDWLHHTHRM